MLSEKKAVDINSKGKGNFYPHWQDDVPDHKPGKLSNFAKAYRLLQRRRDKAYIKSLTVDPFDIPNAKVEKFATSRRRKYLIALGHLRNNANNKEKNMLDRQQKKEWRSRRLVNLIKKYTENGPYSPIKHKGLYMEWTERLGTILLDGFNMLSEKKVVDINSKGKGTFYPNWQDDVKDFVPKKSTKLSAFAKAYRLASRRLDKAGVKAIRSKNGPKAKQFLNKRLDKNFQYQKTLKSNASSHELDMYHNQEEKKMEKSLNDIPSRRQKMLKKYKENPTKKHKGLYMEWTERLGTILLDGFTMLNEFSKPDPKLSNFAKAYRLAQRKIDKPTIKIGRVMTKEGLKNNNPSTDTKKMNKARSLQHSVLDKWQSRLDNLVANADISHQEMYKRQGGKVQKRLWSPGSPSRRMKMISKYTDPESPKKHKGLYMECTERLGTILLEQTLSLPAKKYKENKRKTEELSDKDPVKAYPHFLSARYYRNKIKKNPERVKARGN